MSFNHDDEGKSPSPSPIPGGFHMQAKGDASADAQVEYLKKIIQIQLDVIATLELQLKTVSLQKGIDETKLLRTIDELVRARGLLKAMHQVPKKRWWKFR
jgi:hypothetical protein